MALFSYTVAVERLHSNVPDLDNVVVLALLVCGVQAPVVRKYNIKWRQCAFTWIVC